MIVYWFLPAILILGVITTYTDLKGGKIRNKHVIIALAYSFTAYMILIFSNVNTIRAGYFIELLIMCTFSLVTGFILWYTGLWTAGDAKLFFAFATLIPLSVYKHGHIPYFDSTNILINTFIPVFLYLSLLLMLKTNLKQKIFFLKESIRPREVLELAVFLFAFTWAMELVFKAANLPMDYFAIVSLLFVITIILEKTTSVSLPKIILITSILRIMFDPSIYSFEFVKRFVLIIALFILLRFFVIRMSFYSLTKEVDIKLLKKGMIPAEAVYVEGGKYKKQESMFFGLFTYLGERTRQRNYLFHPTEPLNEKNINNLKRLGKELGFEHLRIQQIVPFAPFLFIGVLLTLLVQGNIFVAVARLFS